MTALPAMWARADFPGRGFISHVLLVEGSYLKLGCRNKKEILYSSRPGREVGVAFRPQVCLAGKGQHSGVGKADRPHASSSSSFWRGSCSHVLVRDGRGSLTARGSKRGPGIV